MKQRKKQALSKL